MGNFIDNKAGDVRSWFLDLRDNISGLADWSVLDQNISSPLAMDDYYVLEHAPTGEDIRVRVNIIDATRIEIAFRLGIWDTGDKSFSTTYYSNNDLQLADQSSNTSDSEATVYDIQYRNNGFATFCARQEGDGHDKSLCFGLELVNKAWNYNNANTKESELVIYGQDAGINQSNRHYASKEGITQVGGEGLVNPDANFNNYTWNKANLKSGAYTDADGDRAYIGDAKLIIIDRSGDNASDGDIITEGGVDIYKVRKLNGLQPTLIRMD